MELTQYQKFVATSPSSSTQDIYNYYSIFGNFDYTDCDEELIKTIILATEPKYEKSITTACNVFKRYAEYLGNNRLKRIIENINRNELWNTVKPNVKWKKFISISQYKEICYNIGLFEEYNSLYYETLFMAVYEGIYSRDISVLKNLRARDVTENEVILHTNSGESYKLDILKELANNLHELAEITVWEQTGRYTLAKHKLVGNFNDTCFKTSQRGNKKETDFYYRRIRYIYTNYVGYPLPVYELFVSGVMNRIVNKLKAEDISVQEAFALHNRNRTIRHIFLDELTKCRYPNTVSNFRELIRSYLEVFCETD